MAHSAGHDIYSGVKSLPAIAPIAVTAEGSGDATTANGIAVDLLPSTHGGRFNSALLVIHDSSVQDTAESIALTALVQDSPNNSDWATLNFVVDGVEKTAAAVVYTHTAATDAAEHGSGHLGVDLSKADRYIRCVLNPDMSRTGTDTASVTAVWVLGNPDKIPLAA